MLAKKMEGKHKPCDATPPPSGHPRALNPWDRLPPIRTSSMDEQRFFYSEGISTSKFQSCTTEIQQGAQGHSKCSDLNTTSTPKTPDDQWQLFVLKYHKPNSQHLNNSYFCQGGTKPKVQKPYQTVPGQIPRKLAIERLRREYLKLDFEQLLAEKGIDPNILIPRHPSNGGEHVTTTDNPVSPHLPLEIFDNEDYDCWTPEDWLALGKEEGSIDLKPVPAKALLPIDDDIASVDPNRSSLGYSWHLVGVLDYSKEICQYLVQKVHQNSKLTDEEGNPALNKKHRKRKSAGVNTMIAGAKFWVPRIRLIFSAEDPRVFVERIQFALHLRENAEALSFYHSCVDCMPFCRGTPTIDTHTLRLIKTRALSTPVLRLRSLERCVEDVEKLVIHEYERTMNRLVLDKVVESQPEKFSHITVPLKDVPTQGRVQVPSSPYEKSKSLLVLNSMLMEPVVFSLLSDIWSECSKVQTMRLFNVTSVEPLRLDEFELIQTHTQISLFLRKAWLSTIVNIIHSKLAAIGKGWYNVNGFSWDMWKLSKSRRLLALVRLKLQDSLHFLIQNSLVSLTELLLNACHSVLTCPRDLAWGNNLITSPYKPKKNPVFMVDLVLNETGVHYSTAVENFETSIMNLFDKAILATHKLVMRDLFMESNQMLKSVNLCEPEVVQLRETIRNALVQAAIPLTAYAAEYEKYLELHNLGIEALLKSYTSAELTIQELKKEVEKNLKDKEMLECSLPSSIVIGPFMVSVEAVRQALCDKRTALANALLDHLTLKLRHRIDEACEEYKKMNRKLFERVNNIEELTKKSEWKELIPEQLKSYQEVVDQILLDYKLIEDVCPCLSNEDFNEKWTAIEWPHQILSQMESAAVQDAIDEDHFNQIQPVDRDTLWRDGETLKGPLAETFMHSAFSGSFSRTVTWRPAGCPPWRDSWTWTHQTSKDITLCCRSSLRVSVISGRL
uniref:dynein heavy chain 1, axonemal-like isoform X4 n=1 Tax=Gasterosteus aculeatus aculeatus TaxID=481459 RepID=UPI001A998BAB|nr:dynein heavy chain 1, axonemal-like isoform X4 [Gasterosteus aculeatus aculeatus]